MLCTSFDTGLAKHAIPTASLVSVTSFQASLDDTIALVGGIIQAFTNHLDLEKIQMGGIHSTWGMQV